MTPNEHQANALRTMEPTEDVDARLAFGAALAAGEAGELLNIANKVYWQHHPLDAGKREKLIEEAGDVLWGLCVALDAAGATLEECMAYNRTKLARRYPSGHFTTPDSIARVDTNSRVDAILEDAHTRAADRLAAKEWALVDALRDAAHSGSLLSRPGVTIGSQQVVDDAGDDAGDEDDAGDGHY